MWNSESNWKPLYEVTGYLTGKGLNYSRDLIIPEEADTLSIPLYKSLSLKVEDLDRFANNSWDYVIVGNDIGSQDKPLEFLVKLTRKLRIGGHLIFVFHKDSTKMDTVEPALIKASSWIEKHQHTQNGLWVSVYKRTNTKDGIRKVQPRPSPSALVVRYGAIGDMIIATPLFRLLHEDGYHVTVNATPYSIPVLYNNPYIENIVVHEKAIVPNRELEHYWNLWKSRYDKFINLSESIEGSLLKVEGRRDFYTPVAWRTRVCSKNYYDHTMAIGGYPNATGLHGEIYFDGQDKYLIQRIKKRYQNKFLIVCALCGSSHHKIYPLMAPVLSEWLDKHPDAHAILMGDKRALSMVWEHPQVENLVHETYVRNMLRYVAASNCVIGPETSTTNAAGALDIPVITMLSHSGHDQMCKNFKYDYCLSPDPALSPCYGTNGCHQLHYTLTSCPQGEIVDGVTKEVLASGPLCAMGAISGERVQDRLDQVYTLWKKSSHDIIYDRASNELINTLDRSATSNSCEERVT